MLRRLAILCIALLALLGLRELIPGNAHGQSSSFRILSSSNVLVGETVYHAELFNPPIGWRQMPYLSLTLPPVQPSSLVSLSSDVAITDTGEGWVWVGGATGWQNVGQIPGTVGVTRTSWGAVKSRWH